MDKTLEVSHAAPADEVVPQDKEPASKQFITSHEATSREKGEPDAIIVYSTSLGLTPLNYPLATIMTRDQVQENDRISMQNSITTQFSNLGVVLLQNLQQAQMIMLGVVAPTPVPTQEPTTLKPTPLSIEATPPTQPSPPPQVQD
ncbi:hypothetical protein JHK82_052897 [Glycine max]|nr:hypothetical protein JHK84_052776 [Glycine max]KAG5085500.1 hypothetical protein JHK82_052897 [Glycine max]